MPPAKYQNIKREISVGPIRDITSWGMKVMFNEWTRHITYNKPIYISRNTDN